MRRFAILIASGFGSGYLPVAPGTAGSLVALGIGAALMQVSLYALPVAAVLACAIGVWAVGVWSVGACGGSDDPGWIVIDEFAGMWIAMLALPRASWFGLASAFALFRLFDITKPGPVGWADRHHNKWGVMGDDIIAGGLVAIILLLAQRFIPFWPV